MAKTPRSCLSFVTKKDFELLHKVSWGGTITEADCYRHLIRLILKNADLRRRLDRRSRDGG